MAVYGHDSDGSFIHAMLYMSAVFNVHVIVLTSLCCQIVYALPGLCKDKLLYQVLNLCTC